MFNSNNQINDQCFFMVECLSSFISICTLCCVVWDACWKNGDLSFQPKNWKIWTTGMLHFMREDITWSPVNVAFLSAAPLFSSYDFVLSLVFMCH